MIDCHCAAEMVVMEMMVVVVVVVVHVFCHLSVTWCPSSHKVELFC